MVSLTGDRPSGKLHLGHYVGSLLSRLELQESCQQLLMIADVQALADHRGKGQELRENAFEMVLDYLAVGLDPARNAIFLQSTIPELFELTVYFLNLTSWQQLQHNPTVKMEIEQKGFRSQVPAGFFTYPVAQAADIAAFRAEIVPVGEDQLPMIEQTRKLIRAFNNRYGNTFPLPQAKLSAHPRLPGTDGIHKMSKSLGNAIYLSDSADIVAKKVKKMLSDPDRIDIRSPGRVSGHPVFAYLDAFDPDRESFAELCISYEQGGVSDLAVKERLIAVLEAKMGPIRRRRQTLAQEIDPQEILAQGWEKAKELAGATLQRVRQGMGIGYRTEQDSNL